MLWLVIWKINIYSIEKKEEKKEKDMAITLMLPWKFGHAYCVEDTLNDGLARTTKQTAWFLSKEK